MNKYNLYLYYFYQDVRAEQPGLRVTRQITGRNLSLGISVRTTLPWYQRGANPRGGKEWSLQFFTYAPRDWKRTVHRRTDRARTWIRCTRTPT